MVTPKRPDEGRTSGRADIGTPSGRGSFRYHTWPELEYDGAVVLHRARNWLDPQRFDTVLHEIGHAMSQKHPGNYDINPQNAPPGPYLPPGEDHTKFTVMSYNGNPELNSDPQRLMLYDIAALQQRWGRNGARALMLDDTVGRLAAGMQADLIAVDFDTIATTPVFDPVSHLVYSCGREQVTDSWIAGRQVMTGGQLNTLEADDIKARASALAAGFETG